MKKIKRMEDLALIEDSHVREYVSNLLSRLIQTFGTDDIEPYGAIFYIEDESDVFKHQEFCLSMPLKPERFEWISDIGSGYLCGCVVINNSKAISIIGKAEFLSKYKED